MLQALQGTFLLFQVLEPDGISHNFLYLVLHAANLPFFITTHTLHGGKNYNFTRIQYIVTTNKLSSYETDQQILSDPDQNVSLVSVAKRFLKEMLLPS